MKAAFCHIQNLILYLLCKVRKKPPKPLSLGNHGWNWIRTDVIWQMNPTNKKGACSSRQNNQTADVHWTFSMTVWFQCQHKYLSRIFHQTHWNCLKRFRQNLAQECLPTSWWLMANMEKKSRVLFWRSNDGCLGLVFIIMLRTTHAMPHYKKKSVWLSFELIKTNNLQFPITRVYVILQNWFQLHPSTSACLLSNGYSLLLMPSNQTVTQGRMKKTTIAFIFQDWILIKLILIWLSSRSYSCLV